MPLDMINRQLADVDALGLIEWGAETYGDGLVMSSSFGIHAAVTLHLANQVVPGIPVIWVDTGYLPTETYQFAEQLIERLQLNVKVYQSPMSPARMEACYGRLWEANDINSLNRYHQIRKVEPMWRALGELDAIAWIAGLRADQTSHRQQLRRVEAQASLHKLHPILHWSARDVYKYLMANNLPYHPLFDQGYTTVGDWHSSRPVSLLDEDDRDTRFRGIKQECGLHLEVAEAS